MRHVLGISLCLLAVGCVKADVHRLDQVVRPVRSPDSVAVLAAQPDQAYTVIAVVESRTEAVFKGFDDLRQRMVAEAAQLGGHALILGPEAKKSNMIITGPALIFWDQKRLSGEVIVFDSRR